MSLQNGPIQIANDFSVHKNDFSWDRLADWVWIDTPLCVSADELPVNTTNLPTAAQVFRRQMRVRKVSFPNIAATDAGLIRLSPLSAVNEEQAAEDFVSGDLHHAEHLTHNFNV